MSINRFRFFLTKRELFIRCVLLLMLLIFLTGNIYGKSTNFQWHVYEIDNFLIQSPFTLEAVKMDVVKGQRGYTSLDDGKGFHFCVMVTPLSGEYSREKIENIPSKLIKSVKKNNNFSNIKTDIRSITCSGLPAMLTTIDFVKVKKDKRVPVIIKQLDVKNDKNWWAVQVWYDPKNTKNEKMANRVIESFRILK